MSEMYRKIAGEYWREIQTLRRTNAALLEAMKGLLTHACIADAAPEDVDEEDRALERAARAAIALASPSTQTGGERK